MKVFHVSWNDPELYFMKCLERKISQCILPFNDIFRQWFLIKATCNGSLSKLSWIFLKDQWFFIISNALKGFLSKPLELSVFIGSPIHVLRIAYWLWSLKTPLYMFRAELYRKASQRLWSQWLSFLYLK